MQTRFLTASLLCAGLLHAGSTPYPDWQYSGSIYILTSPDGADLPASAVERDFPLLVRLNQGVFDFSQARPDGEDLRFSAHGQPLAYQVEAWDPVKGIASVWVRIPVIQGNARQEIRVHWGRADAVSESRGSAVFGEFNGYLSVWHMDEPVKDEVGTLDSNDAGTATTAGVIGPARRLAGGQGIFCGDNIANYPSGASPHSSEAWFRAEKPNATLLAWGNEQAQGKVVLQFRSPPHVNLDCYFSDGNVKGGSTLPLSEWIQVVHTYQKGDSRVYVNGVLDGAATSRAAPLNIRSPARLWIGGWYHNYDFIGDIDEVRISRVSRSADWIRLQYENQKPLQTLTGPVVPPGQAFSVSPARLTVPEGASATLSAEAGGAQKVYWILKRDGRETIVAVDRFQFTFETGRVAGDQSATLQFKAICANEVKARDIPIAIREAIPEPLFTLQAPAAWDGRQTIEIVPRIANLPEMQARGAGELDITWSVSDIAVIREIRSDRLVLTRAQNSGKLTVTATMRNGGQPATRTATILVTEPPRDAWVQRLPGRNEKPEDNQFYARDDTNEGTLYYRGTLSEPAESVFLNVYADGQLHASESSPLAAERAYAFAVKLKPGLVRYRVEFGATTNGRATVLQTVTNVVCGDAYLVQGQSNAVATDWGPGDFPETSGWIRSYGSMGGDPARAAWGNAIRRGPEGRLTIGYWAFDLARRLVEEHQMPICILNGAVGGTRIDQHQRNPEDPADLATIYGRLLWRVRQARLTHGIRGVLWHQGENDQGADGPTGGFGWETHRQYFIELAAAWKQDYPNLQHYYLFQIWPKSCAMGVNGSDNRLREVQRTLPTAFSRMSVMSTLGIEPPGGCHYPAAGYAEMARLIGPLVERDNYGRTFLSPITPPNLKRACWANGQRDELTLEFDQPVKWDPALASEFQLDGEPGQIASGAVSGAVVTLKLAAASTARTLTYLDSGSWSQDRLLRGENGIAALTFCEVPIEPSGLPPMHFVVVMKSHFDIGYSALARDVEHEYRTTMIDRALETMEQNARLAGPGEQFVWTIPGWPMQTILWDGQNPARKRRIEEALQRGNLVMHALPYTIETGSADIETLARCFIYSSRIARQYGLPLPNDAKMTDVPGHDWIIPTLLHHAGVKFFHLGANPTNIQVKQPRLFWWEGPDGSRVLTMYSNGYDSGLLPPADWPHRTWLAMVMGGDNEGPPSAASVRGWISTIKQKFPNAKITVGRMEDFADSLLAENPELPVVRGNVSDSWIHGLASSPNAMKTLANVRPKIAALNSLRTLGLAWGVQFRHLPEVIAAGYDSSLRWSEHTWGLANQHFVPGLHGEAFSKAYAGGLPPNYEHMVESWKDHDKFAFRVEDTIVPKLAAELHTLAENVNVAGLRIVAFNPLPWARDGVVDFAFPFMGSIAGKTAVKSVDDGEVQALQTWGAHSHRNGRFVARDVPAMGYRTYVVTSDEPGATSLAGDAKSATIENRWLKVTFDPTRGCIASIIEKSTGVELVDNNSPHGFGQYLYQQFSREECDAYINRYIFPQYRGSHGPITGKSIFVPESAPHIEFSPANTDLEITQNGFSITARLIPRLAAGGSAHTAGLTVTLYEDLPALDLKVNIVNHPATENPEAGWISLPLAIRDPRFRLRTPGAITDPPRDMIEGGNFAFFWTQGGVSICDSTGRGVGLCSPDAPALSLGEPGAYRFEGQWPNPKSWVYVHLFNNQWNTNFRSFWSGEFSARVRLWPITEFDPERDLVTPSEETLSPMLTGLSNYQAGTLPPVAKGITLSRKGVTVTAFGPNPDGEGTLLRLWELAGTSGDCTVTLPEAMKVNSVQPVDLRGRPTGKPLPVQAGQITVPVNAFAPFSLRLADEE